MVKLIIAVLLALVLIVFIAQNTMVVNVNFIAWTMPISLAFLLLLVLFFGVLFGFVATEVARLRKNLMKWKKEKREEGEKQAQENLARQKQDDKKEKQTAKQRRRNK